LHRLFHRDVENYTEVTVFFKKNKPPDYAGRLTVTEL